MEEATSFVRGDAPGSGDYDAFISYRRTDERVASAIYELLVLFGQRVFLDRQCIRLGDNWDATLLLAARKARRLLVLWSRNAAASSEMKRELEMVTKECRIVPIRLDNSPLPPALSAAQSLEGLDVASRILARGRELVLHSKQSQSEAMASVVKELRSEGVELTPEQERRTRAYLGVLERSLIAAGLGTAAWLWSRASRAAVSRAGVSALLLGAIGVQVGRARGPDASPHPGATLTTDSSGAGGGAPQPPGPDPAPVAPTQLCPGADELAKLQKQASAAKRELAECKQEAKTQLDGSLSKLGDCDKQRSAALQQLETEGKNLRECQASLAATQKSAAQKPAAQKSVTPPSRMVFEQQANPYVVK